MEYAEFLNDKKTQDAIVRNLEIIGEATKRLSESLRFGNPQLPWKNRSGLTRTTHTPLLWDQY